MNGIVGRFGARLGQWRRMALMGLAAMFFASGCGQLAELDGDGRDLATAPPASAAVSTGSGLAPTSTFRPLGGGRAPSTSDCTRPANYWHSHPASWWHRELQMGSTTYSKEEQLGILERAATDNGLVGVGQQLIAARLNIAAGVAPTGLDTVLAQADILIGPQIIPPRGDGWRPAADTVTIAETLAAFNEGRTGPGACR
jgi:hypothetical protein